MKHFSPDQCVAISETAELEQRHTHLLMQGDCLEHLSSLPDQSVDLVLTDPPYGTTECKWDSVIPLEQMWTELDRVAKPNAAILLFGMEPFSSMLRLSNLKKFRYDWIYEKPAATGFLNAKRQPLRAHEIISVFYARQPIYNPQKTEGHQRKQTARTDINSECYGKAIKRNEYNSTERYPRSIQIFASDKQKVSLHPTQKPVALMEYLIRTYTDEGATVLDFTMGSGTTGVACVNTGRRFVGIELDQDYFQIASDRIESAQTEARAETSIQSQACETTIDLFEKFL